jgi:hypothetical protein
MPRKWSRDHSASRGRGWPNVNDRAKCAAVGRALEDGGVIFVEENGHGPGVRLKSGRSKK